MKDSAIIALLPQRMRGIGDDDMVVILALRVVEVLCCLTNEMG